MPRTRREAGTGGGSRACTVSVRTATFARMADLSLDDFTAEARAFLDANAQRREAEKKFVWGEGSDNVGMFEERSKDRE